MMGSLLHLPKIKDIKIRPIELGLPFEMAAARVADQRGTVVLLSGSNMDCARFHCLAADPWLELTGYRDKLTLGVKDLSGKWNRQHLKQDPFDLLNELTASLSLPELKTDLPVTAGLFGYFAYDLKDMIEELPRTCADTFLPDISLFAPSILLIQDRKTGQTFLCTPLFDHADSEDKLKNSEASFLKQLDRPWDRKGFSIDSRGFTSSFTKPEYVAAVSKIIRYLRAGDIYQANLSQRFETGFEGDTYSLFLELFDRNPAAFFSYINTGDHQVVSTSPERFIQVCGKEVETRPIKGTLARGKTPEEDKANGERLASSIKDDAELTMIVDLMRNDLSRVTEHGSVEVTEHKRLEPYDNVFHLVSVVKGELQPDKTCVDLIRATFPGGSITGCPKIRSMEIIDELEPVKRHVYTGSIGYISFHGTMDLSIAIRTATINNGQLVFSVGGGIVYDSDPEKEFQETLDKGKTLMDTLMDAASGQSSGHVKAWVNGKLIHQDKATIPAASQGVQYGAGLFETIRVEKGIPVRLDAHVKRLEKAWTKLFGLPVPDITWNEVIGQLVRENGFKEDVCAVKLLVAKDDRPGSKVFLAAFIRPYIHRLEMLGKSGLNLVSFPHPRQSFLADHKTMNYLYYERAGAWAKENGGDEALILNADGSISETNTCNILAVDGLTLLVPESSHVLAGVTQAAVIKAMTEKGYDVRYEKMTPERLVELSNIVLTNALMGAVPVNQINGIAVTTNSNVCNQINAALSKG